MGSGDVAEGVEYLPERGRGGGGESVTRILPEVEGRCVGGGEGLSDKVPRKGASVPDKTSPNSRVLG